MNSHFKKAITASIALLLILTVLIQPQTISAASVKISHKSITLRIGHSKKLSLKNLKSSLQSSVVWGSSNKKVATVSSKGKVVAKSIGRAKITATVNGSSYHCNVTVIKQASNTTTKVIIDNGFIPRTTNKAGNASKQFVKSMKGFTLKILYPWENIYGDKKCETGIKDSKNEIKKEYGITIKEEGQFNRYNENLSSELAAKKCANHIYFAQGGFFPSYFQKDYIADLTVAMRTTGVSFNEPWYINQAKNFLNIDGKQYGWIAIEYEYMTPNFIAYNKSLLNKKRLEDPAKLAKQGKWTWDKLEKYSKKFANDKLVVGFGIQDATTLFEQLANQYGTQLTNISRGKAPTTNITNSKVESALETLQSWTTGKNAWCETFQGKQWSYGKTQFQNGKVAFFFGGHDAIQGLRGTKTQNDINIVPFPTKNGSKNYANTCGTGFVAFIPIVHQSKADKILFARNEYYRYTYRFVDRHFQYKWSSYFGKNTTAIKNASDIKFAKNGNKIAFSWLTICESNDEGATRTASIVNEVVSGKATAAQAIQSKKNALAKSYSKVWDGHKITGNV